MANADVGTHTERFRSTHRFLVGAVNESAFSGVDMCNISKLETVLSHLQYYDPAAPSTLVTASALTGTYKKRFLVQSISHKVIIRNNYQVPIRLKLYIAVPKKDHSQDIASAFTTGIADIGSLTATSPLVYPTDSNQLTNLYKFVKSVSIVLAPGKERVMYHKTSPFEYDPSFVDTHSDTYQARYGASTFAIRVEGVLGHDTSADQQTTMLGGVDVELNSTYKIKYPAGAKIEYIYLSNNADATFTNGGVCTNMPISDNQAYSVS